MIGLMNVSLQHMKLKVKEPDDQLVYRVNWLRAKASSDRWAEELIIYSERNGVDYELFKMKEGQWKDRAQRASIDGLKGHVCYAEKQQVMWLSMYNQARDAFQSKGSLKV